MISQGLLMSMANPSWGAGLEKGVQGMFANMGKAKMLKPLMESSEQYQASIEAKNPTMARQAADSLMAEGKKQGNMEMYNKGLEMRQGVQQIATGRGVSDVNNMRKLLAGGTLTPEQETIVADKLKNVMSDATVSSAVAAQDDAAADRFVKRDALRKAQNAQKVDGAVEAMLRGASEEDVANAYGADSVAKATTRVNEYREEQEKAKNIRLNNTRLKSDSMELEGLSDIKKAEILQLQEANGIKAARGKLAQVYSDRSKQMLKENEDLKDAQREASVAGITQQVVGNSRSEWAMDENIAEWYKGLPEERKTEVKDLVNKVVTASVREKEVSGSEEASSEYIMKRVNAMVGQTYGVDLSTDNARLEKNAKYLDAVKTLMRNNEGLSEREAMKIVNKKLNEARGEALQAATPDEEGKRLGRVFAGGV